MFLLAPAALSFLLITASGTPNTASTTTTSHNSCKAALTASDARMLALETPNARAFVENQKAILKAELVGRGDGDAVRVRVINTANNDELVGIYSVNLRSGSVLDDDQEPAEDTQTAVVRQKLMARHCNGH